MAPDDRAIRLFDLPFLEQKRCRPVRLGPFCEENDSGSPDVEAVNEQKVSIRPEGKPCRFDETLDGPLLASAGRRHREAGGLLESEEAGALKEDQRKRGFSFPSP